MKIHLLGDRTACIPKYTSVYVPRIIRPLTLLRHTITACVSFEPTQLPFEVSCQRTKDGRYKVVHRIICLL